MTSPSSSTNDSNTTQYIVVDPPIVTQYSWQVPSRSAVDDDEKKIEIACWSSSSSSSSSSSWASFSIRENERGITVLALDPQSRFACSRVNGTRTMEPPSLERE
jgi:hypothetical protein